MSSPVIINTNVIDLIYHATLACNSMKGTKLKIISTQAVWAIDNSTPVSQSRHTLRFQPIACRSIIRRPRPSRTRPEMVWQAFVHVVRWRCSTWQKRNQENGIAKKNKKKNGSLAVLTFVWIFPHQNTTVTGLPARGREYFCIRLHHLFGSLARLPKRGGAYVALWSGLFLIFLAHNVTLAPAVSHAQGKTKNLNYISYNELYSNYQCIINIQVYLLLPLKINLCTLNIFRLNMRS